MYIAQHDLLTGVFDCLLLILMMLSWHFRSFLTGTAISRRFSGHSSGEIGLFWVQSSLLPLR